MLSSSFLLMGDIIWLNNPSKNIRVIIVALLFLSLSIRVHTPITGTTLFTPSAGQHSGGEHGLWRASTAWLSELSTLLSLCASAAPSRKWEQ